MADRYWVGGTASWDGTAGTKWATTSGGAGGAAIPSASDDVFFTNLSTGTCTIATGNTGAKSINCTGFTGTITGTGIIAVLGSVTLSAGMTYTHTGSIAMAGTGTLTTAGKVFSALSLSGSANVTLGDALNTGTRTITITQGTFNTANYNVTTASLSSTNSNVRTITLGSSTVATAVFDITNTANLTFNANTSQINITASNGVFRGGSKTFHNVTFLAFLNAGTPVRIIQQANTFNNLTLAVGSVPNHQCSIDSNQTVNGTFTCAGGSAILRNFVRSDVIGTSRTITAAVVSANDCDWRDITIAGGAAPISPTRAGDCGGNSGITFPSAKTVYRVTTNANWLQSAWATTSGGTPDVNNTPLPQDTAIVNNATTGSSLTINNGLNGPNFDLSARTNAYTLTFSAEQNRYGSLTLGSGVTVAGTTFIQRFSGRNTMVFTSAGKTITFPCHIDTPSGTFRLGDAYNSSNTITHTRGTFDANNYNLTATKFTSISSNTRTITMGSGLWTLSGSGILLTGPWAIVATNLTFNKGTANILLSDNTGLQRDFTGGDLAYNKLTIGGTSSTSTTAIDGANSFTELASTKTVAHTVQLKVNQSTIDTWSITGTSGNVVTFNSSAVGTQRTFNLTNATIAIDYMSVKDIGVNQANRFYVGANSTNGGNNTNVIFTVPPEPGGNTGAFFSIL
jgi:hypothetical protein